MYKCKHTKHYFNRQQYSFGESVLNVASDTDVKPSVLTHPQKDSTSCAFHDAFQVITVMNGVMTVPFFHSDLLVGRGR